MRLLTIDTPQGTRAARQDGEKLTVLEDFYDVGTLLSTPEWREVAAAATGPVLDYDDALLAPVVPNPSKIICVGHNYRNHIKEMGREVPEYPALFAKYPESLLAPDANLVLPPESQAVDWEAELAVIVGKRGRRISEEEAPEYIAGYAVLNDVSMRDYQFRSVEWLQGKTWEKSTPVGPALVTSDEFDPLDARNPHVMRTLVNGQVKQETPTADVVFTPAKLVSYISTIVTLNPGDIIATGTPGGVGHARDPKEYLQPGDVLQTDISDLGLLTNHVVAEELAG